MAKQTIFKVDHTERDQWTQILNESVRDPRISFRATGLLCYLLGLPVDWQVNQGHLGTVKKEKRDAMTDALGELQEYGYARKEIIREKGRITGTVWHVFERARDPQGRTSKKRVRTPLPELPETDKPLPELPETVLPIPAKPQLQKKEYTKEIGYKPNTPISPQPTQEPEPHEPRASRSLVLGGEGKETTEVETKASEAASRRVPKTPQAQMMATTYRRPETEPWSEKEVASWKKLKAARGRMPTEAEVELTCRYTSWHYQERKAGRYGADRRDLLTFLNNFWTEHDRAIAWAEMPRRTPGTPGAALRTRRELKPEDLA